MDEQFLHYIWKYQKFETCRFELTDARSLKVFYPGNHNHDSGPDFEEAKIKIEDIEWAGHVEVHINSSDWLQHNHQHDPSYNNVILHVVWNYDKEIQVEGEVLPTLELKNRVDPLLLANYKMYMRSTSEILCASQITSLTPLNIRNMLDRVLIERLEQKSSQILADLSTKTNDWEQMTYRLIAANFGFSTNKETFIRLSDQLPFSTLKKNLQNIKFTEALLFGQAGFLEENIDEYQSELKAEFHFLKTKFQLRPPLSKVHWKYGKLRPGNFPSVRLAQLAALFHNQPQLFTLLMQSDNIAEIKQHLLVDVSEYWQIHYDFGKRRIRPSKKMGNSSFENLIINSMVPLLAAYAKFTGEPKYMNRSVEMLESIHAENNRITKKWKVLDIGAISAFDSQALIQLYKCYCQKRRCLRCNIGTEILNK